LAKFLKLVNGIPRMVETITSIYDETYTVSGTITTGTAITLPASETYTDVELKVYLNGVFLEPVLDYNYVSSPPRTQIQMTFDLVDTDLLRFKKGD